MKSRSVPLSRPRRVTLDMLALADGIPTVPVQRHMNLAEVVAAREAAGRPAWTALFLKAYAAVARRTPALRRAYVKLPWPRLVEYPCNVANLAVERDFEGEPAVFFARIGDPESYSLADLDALVRGYSHRRLSDVKPFRKLLRLSGLPRPLRRAALWLGLNLPRTRGGMFGTFGMSVYSALGSESLHPISPMTTTLTYGVIDIKGRVNVRVVYDHRVIDGASVARALAGLEEELAGPILLELREMGERESKLAAA